MSIPFETDEVQLVSRRLEDAGQALSMKASTSLQDVYQAEDCPSLLRGALAYPLTWQARNSTTIRDILLSPRLSPQFMAALLAWGAWIDLEGQAQSELPLKDFLERRGSEGRDFQAILVPLYESGRAWGESRISRSPADEPIISAYAVVDRKETDRTIRRARLALTGAWTKSAQLTDSVELLVGGDLNDAQIDEVALAVEQEVDPPDTHHGSAEYRREMARLLTRRVLTKCK